MENVGNTEKSAGTLKAKCTTILFVPSFQQSTGVIWEATGMMSAKGSDAALQEEASEGQTHSFGGQECLLFGMCVPHLPLNSYKKYH